MKHMALEDNNLDYGKGMEQKKRVLLIGMRLVNLYGRKEELKARGTGRMGQENGKKLVAAKTSVLKRLHQKQEKSGR